MSTKENQLQAANFLPLGYKVPDKTKQFMKLKQGDNIVRFLSSPLLGSVVFNEESKPVRKNFYSGEFTSEELETIKPKKDQDTGKPDAPKHFWIALVWDSAEKAPKILEITQISILKPLYALVEDNDWGDLRTFDINIHKEGSTKNDTEYTVTPKPHKPLTKEVQSVVDELNEKKLLNLDAIWEGEYPFLTYNY
ncbi:hypothetical protein CMU91_14870 [Elizabethkingia anophelis]|nr:hypothetical protein [Elizabethkingia anophelis]